jgi:co-chaperonin GroES (HSP10)
MPRSYTPTGNRVLVEPIRTGQETPIVLVESRRPETFHGKVIEVGKDVDEIEPGMVVLLPKTMEKVTAKLYLVEETEVLAIVDAE